MTSLADAVSAAYLEAGWTARASLPQQEIVDGVVTIEITEAVFGVATLEGVQPKRIEASYLVKMAQARLTKGKPLHANDLDRVLLLLDDLPGVSVAGHLVAGAHDGETNLMLSAMDDTWANGTAISALNSYSLQGYGASLTWLAPGGMELKATLAKRSAANPTADVTTGQDGDKTKFTTRAWVSAGMAF